MSPKDDKDDQAVGRVVRLAIRNPFIMGLVGVCIGGPVGNYLGTQKPDPRIDTIMVAIREIKPQVAVIGPLQDTVRDLGGRVVKLEDRDRRLAYSPPETRGIGRRREKW